MIHQGRFAHVRTTDNRHKARFKALWCGRNRNVGSEGIGLHGEYSELKVRIMILRHILPD
jgi:hypothetical protein